MIYVGDEYGLLTIMERIRTPNGMVVARETVKEFMETQSDNQSHSSVPTKPKEIPVEGAEKETGDE